MFAISLQVGICSKKTSSVPGVADSDYTGGIGVVPAFQ